MKRWSDLLIALLLLTGASVLLYPTVSDRIASRNHSKAIVEYSITVEELAEQEIQRQLAQAREYNASLSGLISADAFSTSEGPGLSEGYLSALSINDMIGYISIPSIEVYLPVYHTVSGEILRKGVGHLPESALPVGDPDSHAVLTAHRGLPSAKLFTDLNQLQESDLFYLHILDQILCYQVDQILVVEPHETDALQPLPGGDHTTLVTCTPYAINSHRLLVRGKRMEFALQEPVTELLERELERDKWLFGLIALLLLAATIALLFKIRKK